MSVFVNSLLDKQRIAKRKYTVTMPQGREIPARRFLKHSWKPAFRPARIIALFEQNSRVIEKIKQEPGRRVDAAAGIKKPDSQGYPARQGKGSLAGKLNSSLAIPVLSVTAVFVLAFGIFFVVYSQGLSFDWANRHVINSDQDSNYNLALYAGINPVEKPAEAEGEEAIPLDMTESFAWKSYKVKKGDSVSKIAAAYSVSMDAIIASNGIRNARALREGEELRIPNMDGIPYTVKSGDSLSKISRSMGVPLEAILDANDIQSDVINSGMVLFIPGARMKREDLRLALGELFVYPVRGAKLSSPFGWRDDPFGSGVRLHHAAIDLSGPKGTPVKAAMEGRVSSLGNSPVYGNYIIIKHPGEYETMYAHLNTTSVKKGDQVIQGAQIGTMGDTGRTTGPHLHFAVYKNGRAVNPLDLLSIKN